MLFRYDIHALFESTPDALVISYWWCTNPVYIRDGVKYVSDPYLLVASRGRLCSGIKSDVTRDYCKLQQS